MNNNSEEKAKELKQKIEDLFEGTPDRNEVYDKDLILRDEINYLLVKGRRLDLFEELAKLLDEKREEYYRLNSSEES